MCPPAGLIAVVVTECALASGCLPGTLLSTGTQPTCIHFTRDRGVHMEQLQTVHVACVLVGNGSWLVNCQPAASSWQFINQAYQHRLWQRISGAVGIECVVAGGDEQRSWCRCSSFCWMPQGKNMQACIFMAW
eukprot:366242-Chlamydomonas_euryale.AAC.8